jgi:hypothetical protein
MIHMNEPVNSSRRQIKKKWNRESGATSLEAQRGYFNISGCEKRESMSDGDWIYFFGDEGSSSKAI